MIQYLESTASIFANVELDFGGKELNHHFPLSHGSLQVIVIKLIIVFPWLIIIYFRSFTDVGLHQGIEWTRVWRETKSGLFIKLFQQDSWTLLHWTFGTLNIGGTLERFLNFGTNTHWLWGKSVVVPRKDCDHVPTLENWQWKSCSGLVFAFV